MAGSFSLRTGRASLIAEEMEGIVVAAAMDSKRLNCTLNCTWLNGTWVELEEGRGVRLWGVKSNDESISINAEGLRSTAYLGAEVGDDGVLGGGAGQLVEFGAIVEDVVADIFDVGGKGEGGGDFTISEI